MRKMIVLVKDEVSNTCTQGIERVERRKDGNTFIQQIFRGVQAPEYDAKQDQDVALQSVSCSVLFM